MDVGVTYPELLLLEKTMNILIVINEMAISYKHYYAVVPSNLLIEYDLEELDGCTDNMTNQKLSNQVSMLLDRFGLIPFVPWTPPSNEWKSEEWIEPPFTTDRDLMQYLDTKFPITIDKIITIGTIA